jgi:hypothetical protein
VKYLIVAAIAAAIALVSGLAFGFADPDMGTPAHPWILNYHLSKWERRTVDGQDRVYFDQDNDFRQKSFYGPHARQECANLANAANAGQMPLEVPGDSSCVYEK